MHTKKIINGFSLVETMLVVSIIGVVLSFAVPSFKSLMAQRRVESSTQRLISLINRATNEALSRYAMVTLRYNGASWQDNVSMYIVNSGTPNQDPNANDRVILIEEEGNSSVQVTSNGPGQWISINSRGLISNNDNLQITICEPIGDNNRVSKSIEILGSGNTRETDNGGNGSC